AAPLYAARLPVRPILRLLQRRRHGDHRAGLSGGRATDPRRRPRRADRRNTRARSPPRARARWAGRTRRPRARSGSSGRLRGVPRRRIDHAMGLRAAGRARRDGGIGRRCGAQSAPVAHVRVTCLLPCPSPQAGEGIVAVRGDALPFPDITADLKAAMPQLRGRLLPNQPLADLTWFRVGGPAQVLFVPEDEADLACLLAHLPAESPVTVIGLGSNLIVRDGGIAGVVIRLGRGFGDTAVEDGARVRAGA